MSRAVLALLVVGSVALADDKLPPVTGTYHSNWDDVTLTQHGSQVTGTYVCCGGGTIHGTIDRGVIHYRWVQPGGDGRGVWTIHGDRLDGTWGVQTSETDGGRWDMTRVAAGPQLAR